MILHAKSYTSTTAETTIDLRDIGTPGGRDADLVFNIADYDIEVVGNDAEVTLEAVGPFTSSLPFDVSGTTFAIGGGKVSIENFAVAEFVFTRVGTTEFTINIVRRILE